MYVVQCTYTVTCFAWLVCLMFLLPSGTRGYIIHTQSIHTVLYVLRVTFRYFLPFRKTIVHNRYFFKKVISITRDNIIRKGRIHEKLLRCCKYYSTSVLLRFIGIESYYILHKRLYIRSISYVPVCNRV